MIMAGNRADYSTGTPDFIENRRHAVIFEPRVSENFWPSGTRETRMLGTCHNATGGRPWFEPNPSGSLSSSAKRLVHRHGSLGVWAKLWIGVRSTLVLRVPAILLEEKCSMRLQHVHEQV